MTTAYNASTGQVDWVEDPQGRRVRKVVSQYSGSSWVVLSDKRFVYDGWNLIEEQTLSPASSRFYIWGLDLSQSLQGAGGIGGLLATVSGTTTDHFLYDGNGNVGQLVNASGGVIDAQYEYDPYGNLILSTGTLSASNPFRFSTKYLDTETGLYYYGYRYYDPKDGRWLTRDPIEEDGGLNLYAFIINNPVDLIDPLGLDFIAVGSNAAIPGIVPAEIGGHLSITYWKENNLCIKEGDLKRGKISSGQRNWTRPHKIDQKGSDFIVGNNAIYKEVIHLHFKNDFETVYRVGIKNLSLAIPQKVGISRIIYTSQPHNADIFAVIYADSNDLQDAKTKWETIKRASATYSHAEHGPLVPGYIAKNWPNSRYGFLADGNENNSNTFIRYLTNSINRKADIIPGRSHPGNMRPKPVKDNRPAPIFVGSNENN